MIIEEPDETDDSLAVLGERASTLMADGLEEEKVTVPSESSFPCSSVMMAEISRYELIGIVSSDGFMVIVDAPRDWESPVRETLTVIVLEMEGLSTEERVIFVVPGALAVMSFPVDEGISEREMEELESVVHLTSV